MKSTRNNNLSNLRIGAKRIGAVVFDSNEGENSVGVSCCGSVFGTKLRVADD